MYKKNLSNGQVIVRYGDLGDEYFVLARGKIKVTVYLDDTEPNDQALDSKISFEKTLEADFQNDPAKPLVGFGEIALLYNDKRTASITAISECELWALSGDVFKQVIAQHSIRRRNISLEYLDSCELFKELDRLEKLKLIDGLKVVQFKAGDYIIHQGDKGENFFIIETGKV